MSTGMTTFLTLPSAKALSLGLYLFYHSQVDIGSSRRDEDSVDFAISSHPRPRYMQAEMQIISSLAKVPGKHEAIDAIIRRRCNQYGPC